MLEIGRIGLVNGKYEFRDPSRSLIVRGAHPEWVLQAAAEVIGNFSRLEAESLVEELTVMQGLGAVDQAELVAARVEYRDRFEISPRCNLSLGPVEYLWASQDSPGLKPNETTATPLTLGPDMLVTRKSA